MPPYRPRRVLHSRQVLSQAGPAYFGLWSTTGSIPLRKRRLPVCDVPQHKLPKGVGAAGSSMPSSCSRLSALADCGPLRLPSAHVRTAVHVQHLPSDIASFSQIKTASAMSFALSDCSHRRKRLLMKSLGVVLVQRRINHARRNRVEADVALRIFAREAQSYRIQAALGDHRNRSRNARDGVVGQCCRNARYPAAAALRSICLTASWVMKINPSRLVETKRWKSSAV